MRRVAKEMTSQLKSIIPVLPEKKILNDLSLPSSIVLSNHSSGAGTEEREGGVSSTMKGRTIAGNAPV